jgi:hypothetical protein
MRPPFHKRRIGVLLAHQRRCGDFGKGDYFLCFSMPTVVEFLIAPTTWCRAVIDGGREEPNVESLSLMSCLHWSDLRPRQTVAKRHYMALCSRGEVDALYVVDDG